MWPPNQGFFASGRGWIMKPGCVSPRKASRLARLLCLGLALGCAVFVVGSAMLLPKPGGYATHLQLGLPSCGYLARTGYPCPGCGITTSISAMAHGRVDLAFKAQPFGVVLTLGVVVLGVVGFVEFLTGRALISRIRPRAWWLLPIIAAWLVGWAYKLLTGLASGEYPVGR